jgi:superfamily I DNA/RNA helicase
LSFLDQLNPQQREAVETTEGPVLILAGAGSGKTRVITYRIAYLIEHVGVMPESILAMTFTNKAAAEMGERVEKLVGGLSIAKPVISTFHSFCVRVLRRDIEALQIPSATPGQPPIGHTKKFVIYDESDMQSVVKGIMKRLGLDDKQLTPRIVLSRISWAKNHMLDPQELYLQSADPKTEKIAHLYEEYRKELRKANALDFDDLLLEATRLLKTAAPVREYYNRRFQYLLIDEYQDTNRPQYELMRMLAGASHNVCAVGDEDQSIYSWRGADIRNILEFEQDFPEAKIIRLEQNYRSTQNILQAASSVVANNLRRKGKNLWTSRQGGTKIGYYEAPDGENEALFAADHIAKYLREAAQRGEIPRAAVLYRTNSQSRLFEEAMRRYGLKYHVVGGFSFYERAEIKDMISYLKVIQNPDDSISLLRVINTPTRGIGKGTIETIERLALETGLSLWGALGEAIRRQLLPPRALASLRSFRQLILDARAMLAGTFVEHLKEAADASVAQEPPPAPLEGQKSAQSISDQSEDDDAASFDPSEFETFSFDFGANAETKYSQPFTQPSPPSRQPTPQASVSERVFVANTLRNPSSENRISGLAKQIEELKDEVSRLRLGGWQLLGILHHRAGQTECHDMFGVRVPENLREAPPNCEHCHLLRRRNDTFVLENEAGDIKQVGRMCLQKFLPGEDFTQHKRLSDRLMQATEEYEQAKAHENPQNIDSIQAGSAGTSATTWDTSKYAEDDVEADDYRSHLAQRNSASEEVEGFRTPGGPASTADILKFLIDRTGYIKLLEAEDTPEAFSRIENLHELVNAAMDSRDRGETLDQFLDHAALISDADDYDERSQVTLMSLHAAKGLEFPLVFLSGLEEGLFPHSRTMLQPDDVEEERRLCYVGMTRAMDQLILTRAVYRRRYGTDLPEASVPSRFLEEVPIQLIEELGTKRIRVGTTSHVGTAALGRPAGRSSAAFDEHSTHYSYEDEDQSASWKRSAGQSARQKSTVPAKPYNSIENIAEFFASRGKKFTVPKMPIEEPSGKRGFRPGQKVRHPKYGEGTVYQREGEGEEAKITVQFPRFGLKKLVEKYAQLERA